MPVKRKSTNSKPQITNKQKEAAEAEIREKQKVIDYRYARTFFFDLLFFRSFNPLAIFQYFNLSVFQSCGTL